MLCVSAHSVAQGQHCLSAYSARDRKCVMPAHMPIERMIQKNTNDVLYESQEETGHPLGAWLTCRPQGATRHGKKRKKTSFVLFHNF
eukprot:5609292-Amphidinium_carterae.1